MAVELKKFQAELQKIDSQITTAYGEYKMVGDSVGNTKQLLAGARLAIGDRVQELRSKGTQGATLADFSGDAEVKAALTTANTALNNFKGIEARRIKNHADFKQIFTTLTDLSHRIDAEIADRKKKLFEPKSLPDMVKLAAKVKEMLTEEGGLKAQSIKEINAMAAPKAGEMESTFRTAVEQELKKSAAIRANASDGDQATAKFAQRLMKLRWDKAHSLAKEADDAVAAALAAKSSGDATTAKQKLALAITKATEMNAITSDYATTYSKNKSFVEQNPDHEMIFKVVSGMTSLANRVLKSVHAAQSTVG